MRPSIGKIAVVGLLVLSMMGTVSGASNSDIVVGHYFNESSSSDPVIDYFGSYDGTNNGADVQQSGFTRSSGDWNDGYSYFFNNEDGDDITGYSNSPKPSEFTFVVRAIGKNLNDGTKDFKTLYANNDQPTAFYDISTNQWQFGTKDSGGTQYRAKISDAQSNVEKYWRTVITSWDGSCMYISVYNRSNNALIGSDKNCNNNDFDWKGDLKIGELGAARHWDGRIDEFRMFNVNLTKSERETFAQYNSLNNAPSIDSKEITPSDPDLDDSIDAAINTSDPDGDLVTHNLSVWEDSTQINDSLSMNNGSQSDAVLNDVFRANQKGSTYYVQFEASDGTATTKENISFTINDAAPNVSLYRPDNQTYFKYDPPIEFSVSDSDSIPGEDWNCDIDLDGSLYEEVYLKEGTNSSYSQTISSDLGSHNVNVSCSDGAGNTGSDLENYEVKSFEIQNIRANSPVYETIQETFESDFKAGSMVNNVTAYLYYDGNQENSENVGIGNSITTTFSDQDFEIPLVQSNATTKNWKYEFQVNYDDFQASTNSSKNFTSSSQSQDIYWSYWIKDSYPRNSQIIEGETAVHNLEIRNESGKASLDASLNFTRTQGLNDSIRQPENSTSTVQLYQGEAYSGEVSQNSRTDFLNTSINISFQEDYREINASDTQETYKIRVDKCGSLSTEALKFKIYNERDRDQLLNTTMNLAFEIWKDPSQKRVFNTSSQGKETHKFCIDPSWAEYTVDSGDKLIQYQDVNENYRLRSYFLLERKISNSTQTIELYDVKATESNRIAFETVDQDNEELPETIIRVERYFPAVDKSLSVAMMRTGSEGRSETFLETNEIYYGFKFYRKDDSGSYVLVQEEPDQIISQDLLSFTVGGSERISYYEFKQGINYNCQYNATQVQCDYSTEQPIDYMELEVSEDRAIQYKEVCQKRASTDSGQLICKNLNASDKDFKYAFKAVTDAGNTVTLETGKSGSKSPSFGTTGYLLSFFLFVTLGFAGFSGPRPIPEISVALTTVAVVISYSLGFLGITYQAAATWVILGAITIWKMSSTSEVGI